MGPRRVGAALHQRHGGIPQVRPHEACLQGGRHGQNPLHLRTLHPPAPGQLRHGRQQPLDLAAAAARKEGHQGTDRIQTRLTEEGGPVALGPDHLHQGMAHEAGVHGQPREERRLEVEEAVEGVQDAPQHRDAALLPCPHLGAHVLVEAHGGQALPQGLGQTQIEPRVVDEQGSGDAFLLCGGQDGREQSVQAGKVLQHLHEAHHGEVLHVRQLAVQVGRHAGAADSDDAEVGATGLQLPQQLRAVEVAGVLPRHHQQRGHEEAPSRSQCLPKTRLSSGTTGRPRAVAGISAGKSTAGCAASRATAQAQ